LERIVDHIRKRGPLKNLLLYPSIAVSISPIFALGHQQFLRKDGKGGHGYSSPRPLFQQLFAFIQIFERAEKGHLLSTNL
jgi:hypothetical protein